MTYDEAIALAGAARLAVDKAGDALESLAEKMDTVGKAEMGVLPDGTPVEDMLAELRELTDEHRALQAKLQTARHLVQSAGSSNSYLTIKWLRELLSRHAI